MTTLAQNKRIHGLRNALKARGFDDADYRALLAKMFPLRFEGLPSSKALDFGQAGELIDALKRLAGETPDGGRRPSQTMEGKFAGVLRALWISGHNLGLIDDPDDRALIAFVERQTHIAHSRFLRDDSDAAKAIEALKCWLARGGVKWPTAADARRDGRHTRGWLAKKAVLDAIVRGIEAQEESFDLAGFLSSNFKEFRDLRLMGVARLEDMSEQFLDEAARRLGQWRRQALPQPKRKTA